MAKQTTTDMRPHLIPGIHSWLAENFDKVYAVILVDHPRFIGPANLPLVERVLPVTHLEDCQQASGYRFKTVILNLGADSVGKFLQDEDGFEVSMRFDGVVHTVYIPFEAIFSILVPGCETVEPFNFILRPGQEAYCIEEIEEESVSVSNGSSMIDSSEQEKPRPRTNRSNHLSVVK